MDWQHIIGGTAIATSVLILLASGLAQVVSVGVRSGMADTLEELRQVNKTLADILKTIERSG